MSAPPSSKALHKELRLHSAKDAYTLEARLNVDGKTVFEQLRFERTTGAMTLKSSERSLFAREGEGIPIHGIFGRLSLATLDVLILVSGRSSPTTLLGQDSFTATDFLTLPLSAEILDVAWLTDPVDKHLHRLLEKGLIACNDRLWFSYERDLTNTLDRSFKRKDFDKALWQKAEDRFFWNRYLQTPLIEASKPGNDLSGFILPFIFGSVEVRQARINDKPFTLCLTSRRSRHRVGTRYFTRGVDKDGHVANSNETEQLLLVDPSVGGHIFSYVQTRGSVPVYWTQINNLRYQPDLLVMLKPETAEALKKHIDDQLEFYGDIYLVNLVNQKGYEKPVKDAFELAIDRLNEPRAHYQYFDFHHECKGMRFDRVSLLVDKLKDALDQQGFFQLSSGAVDTPVKLQKSVVRTNCMDSLDRTNVVQSALAKHVLAQQLVIANILKKGESLDAHTDFMFMYRNLWADHADTISIPYSGTGALKTDFTRTGERTKQGALQDGKNSVVRYLKNNFYDGSKQDAYDLLTGEWFATASNVHKLSQAIVDQRSLEMRAMPYVFFFAVFLLFAALFLPRWSKAPIWLLIVPLLAVLGVSWTYIVGNGISYVDWPKLLSRDPILSYDGRGTGSGAEGKGKGRGRDVLSFKGRPTTRISAAKKAQ